MRDAKSIQPLLGKNYLSSTSKNGLENIEEYRSSNLRKSNNFVYNSNQSPKQKLYANKPPT